MTPRDKARQGDAEWLAGTGAGLPEHVRDAFLDRLAKLCPADDREGQGETVNAVRRRVLNEIMISRD